jgi:predicted nucleic-acid-binding Zn-ribbon protein
MVKIIGQDMNAYLNVTCRNCAAMLLYTRSEVQWQNQTYYGGKLLYKFITCPQCGERVAVK